MSESPETIADQITDNETEVKASESMSNGIATLLGSVVKEMDKTVLETQRSQDDLGKEIERLVAG